MEPLDTIVNALVLGAMGRQWAAADDAIEQYYAVLKQILADNYPSVNLTKVEQEPQSRGLRFILKDDLANITADKDETLLHYSQQLIDVVKLHNPELLEKLGIEL